MSNPITSCCHCPDWVHKALMSVAQFDYNDPDDMLLDHVEHDSPSHIRDQAKTLIDKHKQEQKKKQEQAEIEAKNTAKQMELSGQLIDPSQWGKGKRRPVGIKPSMKNKAQKAVHAVVKGWHQEIPLDEIFDAVINNGLVPIQEDGYKWAGMLMGGKACGTEEARDQHATFPLVTKQDDGQWALTTTYLILNWCTMESGKYEVVCYVS